MGLVFSKGRAEFIRACTVAIEPLLSMVLYLCSEEPEVTDRDFPDRGVSLPHPRAPKKGGDCSLLKNLVSDPLANTRAIIFVENTLPN